MADRADAKTKEQLAAFDVVVAAEDATRLSEKVAVACCWPQEVRPLRYATDPENR
jgi:hypothetical protein